MSVSHAVRVRVDVPYVSKNIDKILQKCSANGLIYFRGIWGGYDDSKILNSQEGAEVLLTPDKNDEGGPFLRASIVDTSFDVRIYKFRETSTTLSFANFYPKWEKDFSSGVASISVIDFARYIRLMCKICDDYPIIGVETDSY